MIIYGIPLSLTVCTKEMIMRHRPAPRYGSLLWLIEAFQIDDETFYIDRYKDLPRIISLRDDPSLQGRLKEARLILEMSLFFKVEGNVSPPNDFSWISMSNYLTQKQEYVKDLEIGALYSLDLKTFPVIPSKLIGNRYETADEAAKRFIRLSPDKKYISFVCKIEAADVDTLEKESGDPNLPMDNPLDFILSGTYASLSAPEARAEITKQGPYMLNKQLALVS